MESHITFFPMGTFAHITLPGIKKGELKKYRVALEKVFDDWNSTFSRFSNDSELVLLNGRAGEWVRVSPRMYKILKKCKAIYEESGGVFDPSVGGLLASVGYGLPNDYRLPDRTLTFEKVEFDDKNRRIKCQPGQILEPASIIKGAAIDEAAKKIKNVSGWMINVGGDILTHGSFLKNEKWNIGIQHHQQKDKLLTVVKLRDCALATSGTYAVKKNGWNHQISAKTGKSLKQIQSLSVIAKTAQEADTISSVAILKGLKNGLKYLENKKVPYFVVDNKNRVYKNDLFSRLEF